jgi:hypothetical protein
MNALTADRKVDWPPPRKLVFSTVMQGMERRKEALRVERQTFLEEWRDISDYMNVRRGRFLVTDNRRKRTSNKVINERGIFASRTCGAGMVAGVSSPSRPWLHLTTPDADMNEYAEVKRWLNIVEKRVYQVFNVSNYYGVKHQSYRDMADYGQGPVIIDQDYENAINCYCSPAGEYYLGVNDRGVVDTMYRDMQKTTKDIVAEFGKYGHIPSEVRQAWDMGDYDKYWTVVGVVQPNIQMIKGMRGPLGMPYMVVYYCLGCSDVDDNAVLAVSGNFENAISAPRWDVQPGDIYGDGPGSIALPIVKSLQVLERRKGQLVDKLVTPPMQAPAKLNREVISHQPGAVSYTPDAAMAGPRGVIMPLYEVHPNSLTATAAENQALEARVDQAYFVDLFLATINANRMSPNRTATATEIAEVHEEKLIALGPVLDRTHYEGLNHDIKRVIGILARARVLPPPPKVMDGMGLKVEYTSLLAVAQRAIGAGAIERFSGFMGNLAAGNPEILDKWDMDQTADEYADTIGVPASMIRSDEEVAKLRQNRAAQMQAQQAAAAAAQTAQTAKVMSEADTGRDSNLLADILGNQGRLV